jgi:hypothetical protein
VIGGSTAGGPEPGKLSPDQASRLLRQAAEKIEIGPASLGSIRARIAQRRRRRQMAWWGGSATVIAAAAIVVVSLLSTPGHTNVAITSPPPASSNTSTFMTPTIETTADATPDPISAVMRRRSATTSTASPTSTTSVGPAVAASKSAGPAHSGAVPGDIDGDGIPDQVMVGNGPVNGSDILLQANLSRLGPDTAIVHSYTGSGTPSILGVADAFQTGTAAIFVGMGRNDQLGTSAATIVVLNGNELQQVLAAPASPYPYLVLNYSFNLNAPTDATTTTTAAGPAVFSSAAATVTSMAYGCANGLLYEDLATQDAGTWNVYRQSFRLKGATLMATSGQTPLLQTDEKTAKAHLAADRCGSVNETGF